MMDQLEKNFEAIAHELAQMFEGVSAGKMMRSPGIKSHNKVFAFYYNQAMIFKLGKRADTYKSQYLGSSYLSPFKHKPPMKGWLVVPAEHKEHWWMLAKEALAFMAQ